jgi:hypothetical protein
MIPSEILLASGEIVLNKDRAAISLIVANTGDRPVQVAVIIILLTPTRLSLSIETLRLGVAWTFRRERLCASSRANRVKFR